RWEDSGFGGVHYWNSSSILQEYGDWPAQAATFGCSVVGLIATLGIVRWQRHANAHPAETAALCELATLWIAAPLASMALLKLPAHPGPLFDWRSPVLFCLLPVWIGDTLAIFVGKAFGRHLLAPKISPKKTVEGGIA